MRPLPALAAVTLILACAPLLAQDDRAATDATVTAIRDAGTTMTSWLVERAGGNSTILDRTATRTSFDWTTCPAISVAEARNVVGPELAAKLAERDGWGHALEYCLGTRGPGGADHLVGVRSPGRDGRFDGTSYAPAGFDPAQPDHDVVWIDGIFVTWPQRSR